eukprot:768458-Prymnesium_polylepis.1
MEVEDATGGDDDVTVHARLRAGTAAPHEARLAGASAWNKHDDAAVAGILAAARAAVAPLAPPCGTAACMAQGGRS